MLFLDTDKYFLSTIFTCRTLTVLILKQLLIRVEIPRIINNISPLKTLHLQKVHFSTHKRLINFLLSFPLLEELETNDVHVLSRTRFVPNTADMIKCLPNLVIAKLSDNKPVPLFLLSRVHKRLSINLTRACCVQVPIFYNLTQLEIFSDLDGQTWLKKWMWILQMLQNSPKLQHLIIHEEIENANAHEKYNWEDPKVVPECLSSQLKTCLLRNYRGNNRELQFAEYIMRSSKVLINMTIQCASSIDLNAKFSLFSSWSKAVEEKQFSDIAILFRFTELNSAERQKTFISGWQNGPSVKFLVSAVHTMEELKLTGNHLKGYRPILTFSSNFEKDTHWKLLKEMMLQGRNADALAQYFGEDLAHCPSEQVVTTLLNFVRMFIRAHGENCKQIEYDKKKAEKEANRK
ncbi:FBD-associated F-box protein [Trifolium repens]|nr:FBD-associated F-box protein [Trifolium repens]